MIFNTFAFFLLFLFPAAFCFRMAPLRAKPWVIVLFGAAFFIYFAGHEKAGWAGAACVLIFVWEALFSRLYKPGSAICFVGIAQSIVLLVLFKYWNFLSGLLFGGPEHNPLYWHFAFLPLGISFFTLEFIHYAVDRYRNKVDPGCFSEYFAFIFFFPSMIAGPIKRYQSFLGELRHPHGNAALDIQRSFTRILTGLVKKFAVADVMTAFTQHLNATDIAAAHRWVLPIWILAYGVQIYFDFSAYSDLAIGSARLFGIKLPENFNWPYLQLNINEFWRHWHISLYTWLVDYVFIPMGGSRVSPVKIYRNVMLTMLVSGIWHGAGLNFVVWGLWHGFLLCAHRFFSRRFPAPHSPSAISIASRWALTFICVQIGWIFFSMDIHTAAFFIHKLVVGS